MTPEEFPFENFKELSEVSEQRTFEPSFWVVVLRVEKLSSAGKNSSSIRPLVNPSDSSAPSAYETVFSWVDDRCWCVSCEKSIVLLGLSIGWVGRPPIDARRVPPAAVSIRDLVISTSTSSNRSKTLSFAVTDFDDSTPTPTAHTGSKDFPPFVEASNSCESRGIVLMELLTKLMLLAKPTA